MTVSINVADAPLKYIKDNAVKYVLLSAKPSSFADIATLNMGETTVLPTMTITYDTNGIDRLLSIGKVDPITVTRNDTLTHIAIISGGEVLWNVVIKAPLVLSIGNQIERSGIK